MNATKVIAHRGFSSVAPENTLAAFEKAIELGVEYFELDVQKTKDNTLVVIHDYTLERTSSSKHLGAVIDLDYTSENVNVGYPEKFNTAFAEEKLPTLEDALRLAKGKIKVCIEIKVYGIEHEIIELVRNLDMVDEIVIFSFFYPVLAKIRQLHPTIPILYLKTYAESHDAYYAQSIGAKTIGISADNDITADFIQNSHAQGVDVWCWTVNKKERMHELLNMGIDALITDYPDIALNLLKA